MKPTMRFKQRYILFEVNGNERDSLTEKEVRDFIFESLLSFFGEEGFARLAFKLISYDNNKKRGILRCERSMVGQFIASFALCGGIGGKNARIECLQTSGTIRKLASEVNKYPFKYKR